jgi:PKD repeat protein
VLFSADGGVTFSRRNAGLPAAIVTKIVAVSPDGRSAYVTFGGFLGNPSRHVFETSDAGMTWTNISSNLPDVPVTSLAVDPSNPNGLYVGTDVGVFRTVNGGASWTSFNQGLPNASVYGLAFSPVSGDLYAATYGRGVFRITNSGTPPVVSFSFSPPNPTTGQSVQFTDTSTYSPTSWLWSFGDGGTSTAQNPAHAYAAAGTFTVSLTATNAAGSNSATRVLTVASPAAVGRGHLIPLPPGGSPTPISGRH